MKTGTRVRLKAEGGGLISAFRYLLFNTMISKQLPDDTLAIKNLAVSVIAGQSPLRIMVFPHLINLTDSWSIRVRFFIMVLSRFPRSTRARNIHYAAGGF